MQFISVFINYFVSFHVSIELSATFISSVLIHHVFVKYLHLHVCFYNYHVFIRFALLCIKTRNLVKLSFNHECLGLQNSLLQKSLTPQLLTSCMGLNPCQMRIFKWGGLLLPAVCQWFYPEIYKTNARLNTIVNI